MMYAIPQTTQIQMGAFDEDSQWSLPLINEGLKTRFTGVTVITISRLKITTRYGECIPLSVKDVNDKTWCDDFVY